MKSPVILSLLSAMVALSACQAVQLVPGSNTSPIQTQNALAQSPIIPGEIVIQYQNPQAQIGSLQSLGLQTLRQIGPGLVVVRSPLGAQSTTLLQKLNADPQVAYAEPNFRESVTLVREPLDGLFTPQGLFPNDPMYSQQYAHKVADSAAGWRKSKGSDKVTIAIVDTGVDLKHPDLAAKIVPGFDFVDNDDLADDGHGHGTHCAGIAAAITDNGEGVAGFAPGAKIMPIRVLGNDGSGSSAQVAEGIRWAVDHGAQVISMSLGSYSDAKVKADAVKYALSKNAVVVAAMGNDGNKRKIYPAAQEGVISVGSTDKMDRKSSFSQYGRWINVTAPGSRILSTWPTSGVNGMQDYGSISGTSMATPAVAGVVAEIRAMFPFMDVKEVTAHLEQSCDDLGQKGFDEFYGHGRINLSNALTR